VGLEPFGSGQNIACNFILQDVTALVPRVDAE
jgi:hypothetical protein